MGLIFPIKDAFIHTLANCVVARYNNIGYTLFDGYCNAFVIDREDIHDIYSLLEYFLCKEKVNDVYKKLIECKFNYEKRCFPTYKLAEKFREYMRAESIMCRLEYS